MRKNFFKMSALFVLATVGFVSCVETEELDSVKAMREAKTNSLVADTQIKLANLAALRIQNSYDSINNVYALEVSKATTDAQVVEAKARLERANAALAAEVENSKATLSRAIVALRYQQINEIQAQAAYDEELLNNPEKRRLTNDYDLFYNGYGTTTDGISISDGIYGLKSNIIGYNLTKLSYIASKESAIESDANSILAKKALMRQDSVDIDGFKRVLAIGIAAKNTADYTTAYNNLVTMTSAAYNDYNSKKEKASEVLNSKNLASAESTIANSAYSANNTKKTNSKTAMTNVLSTYGASSIDGVTTILGAANVTVANALKTKNDADAKVNIWKVEYGIVNAQFVALNTKKNSAELAMQQAQYQVDTANVVAPMASSALTDSVTSKTTQYNNVVVLYNAANATNTTVLNSYTAAQTSAQAAQTAYTNALTNVETITANIAIYNSNKVIYDAAVAAEAGLLATKNAKTDALTIADAAYVVAQGDETNANTYYTALNSAKTTMKGVMDGIYNANVAIDGTIASTKKSIDEKNNDIADLKLQIARVGDTNQFDYDEEIAILDERIDVATRLLTLYEAKASALAVKIAAL